MKRQEQLANLIDPFTTILVIKGFFCCHADIRRLLQRFGLPVGECGKLFPEDAFQFAGRALRFHRALDNVFPRKVDRFTAPQRRGSARNTFCEWNSIVSCPRVLQKKDSDPPVCGLHNVPLERHASEELSFYDLPHFIFFVCRVSRKAVNEQEFNRNRRFPDYWFILTSRR